MWRGPGMHLAATILEQVLRFISVLGMLVFQTTLNFIIPSGSGQAAVFLVSAIAIGYR